MSYLIQTNLFSNAEGLFVAPAGSNAVLPAVLRLTLTKKWFDMTKTGIKTEDYREINEYWIKRLTDGIIPVTVKENVLRQKNELPPVYKFKKFDCNIMTLGYPSNSDTEKILKFQHNGIEIRTGNPEWGAEPNRLYFVILHGAVIA